MAVEIEVVDANNPEPRILKRAARLIAKGEVVVFPTDTCYIFAANALEPEVVTKVFNLKGRSYSNPIHVAVSSIKMAKKYAYVNKAAQQLARNFLPGALTLVLPKKEIIPSLLVAGRNTVGIRIPDNRVILNLIMMTSLPLTATSANTSGQPAPYSVQEIVDQLGEAAENVALVLDQGILTTRDLSTIVDLTVDPPQVLRQGRITEQEILQALKSVWNSD